MINIAKFLFIKYIILCFYLQCMEVPISLNPHQLSLSNFLDFVNLIGEKWSVSVFLSSFSYYERDCSSFTHFRAICIFFSIKYLLISFTLSSIVLVRFFYCYFPSYLFMREINRLWYKMPIFPQCGTCLLILLIKDFYPAVHM